MASASEIDSAENALRRGDLLAVRDFAATGLARDPGSSDLQYLSILALARMGSSGAALEEYEASGLGRSQTVAHRALLGRLLKDSAVNARGAGRAAGLAAAREAYQRAFEESDDPFPGINAATLACLAGDRIAAGEIARRVLEISAVAEARSYFAAATRAEALLVIGDTAAAAHALQEAVALPDADDGARSSTLRQFRLLIECLSPSPEAGEALLETLRPPPVVTYCGHMFRCDPHAEARISAKIDLALHELGMRIAYGSLACGADIMIAEAVLRRGGELNIVLPFDEATFVRRSVRVGGERWLPRFEKCRDSAASFSYASTTEYVGDRGQFRFGLLLAMGLARLRAAPLATQAVQLAIWDGRMLETDAGTSAEVRHWRQSGGRTCVVEPGPIDRRCGQRLPAEDRPRRALRAIVFADFAGFSRLGEAALPAFSAEVLGRVAAVLARHDASICARNTWGDGVFVILDSAAAAASVAAELQRALRSLDSALLREDGAGMRISAHFGPVYEASDPVTGAPAFFGREVTCAARIEPVTPVGGLYVTQPLAAMLAMEAPGRFDLSYLGRIALDKGYGTIPIYRLEPSEEADAIRTPPC
ncbi:MAG: hypothetical protein JWO81_2145 [Alphaproteobacteria bacterium]|nr:hypothetical protein [Alphaproteobacteria bacterium]